MLEPLFQFLQDSWDLMKPWQRSDPDEAVVFLRLGKFLRTETNPGLHPKRPFFDETRVIQTSYDEINLSEQTLPDANGKEITISCVVTYMVTNPEKASLKRADYEDAVTNECYGEIGRGVAETAYKDMNNEDFMDYLRDRCHKRTIKFGVTVERVSIDNLCTANNLRLMGMG